MKEQIDNTELIHYRGLKYMFPHYFMEDYSPKEMVQVLEKVFPEEYKTWARELVGGNDGAHKIDKDDKNIS